MPVRTDWKITYKTCGHTETKDLSHKAADKRAGFARWLSDKATCTACWRKDNNGGDWIEDKQEWITKKREEEAAAAKSWAQQTQMPELIGRSEKATNWATRVRYELMHELYTWAVEEGNAPDDYDTAEETARSIDDASWWLDQREQAQGDPEALVELLQAAADSGDGVECENPA